MMMKNYDQIIGLNHNPNWPYILDRHYTILIIGGSESDIDKIYLYDDCRYGS